MEYRFSTSEPEVTLVKAKYPGYLTSSECPGSPPGNAPPIDSPTSKNLEVHNDQKIQTIPIPTFIPAPIQGQLDLTT